jgi:hypothetical protein
MEKNLEGKTYHIEGNGSFITIEEPNCDKMPKLNHSGVKVGVN